MPVGNPNDGIGLLSGQIMLSNSTFLQFIDWYHDPVSSEPEWQHSGTFQSYIVQPSFSIGVTNDINISITQSIGLRNMNFSPKYIGTGNPPGDFISAHHRNENSLSDFVNAIGGMFGDLSIMGKFILYYTDSSEGSRIFFSSGLTIPSKNILKSDPYFRKEIDTNYGNSDGIVQPSEIINFNEFSTFEDKEHKHFAMSDGAYRLIFEPSYYYKKFTNPVFLGISLRYATQVASKTTFNSSDSYDLTFTSLFASSKIPTIQNIIPKNINFSFGTTLSYIGIMYWDGYRSPISDQLVVRPSYGILFNTDNYGTFNLIANTSYYFKGVFQDSNDSEPPGFEQRADEYSIMFNYRIPLDSYIW